MTRVTCRLTAQNRDQVRNPPLGNRVWANFTILIHNSSLNTSTHSARKVGFIFDEHLTFSDQSSLQIVLLPYCQLRCIHPYFDTKKTSSTIITSIVHSKLDYCNSLCHNLPKSQITRLQQTQNSLARAVVEAPKSSHITPILWSLHWLKITERIEY